MRQEWQSEKQDCHSSDAITTPPPRHRPSAPKPYPVAPSQAGSDSTILPRERTQSLGQRIGRTSAC
jgi:hypothetical protein